MREGGQRPCLLSQRFFRSRMWMEQQLYTFPCLPPCHPSTFFPLLAERREEVQSFLQEVGRLEGYVSLPWAQCQGGPPLQLGRGQGAFTHHRLVLLPPRPTS